MQFLREDQTAAVAAIHTAIASALADTKRVLWLVSGGSNIAPQVAVMKALEKTSKAQLAGLAILPIDERYGPAGHADSNIAQLLAAGFRPGKATIVDVLSHDQPFEQTVGFYGEVASAALANAQVIVAQFGLGSDGHIAGLLPQSPAITNDPSAVIGYNWSDYVRLTLSPEALRRVTRGFVLAYGDGKRPALERLQQHSEPWAELPAELLYELPDVQIYTDQQLTQE